MNALTSKDLTRTGFDTEQLVQHHVNVSMNKESTLNKFSPEQIDILAYRFPYDMLNNINMQLNNNTQLEISQEDIGSLEDRINQFNIRYPMLQLRFNVHDWIHRPSCFKKGNECRTQLPQKHRLCACLVFDEDKSITWHFVDGTSKKICPFKYYPKRNIGDQFMNVNNDIATTVLACNNNVTSGDKACFFYVTLYQSKHNQTDEAHTYHSICLALSRRIKWQQEQMVHESNVYTQNDTDRIDYCEGLKRMLSSLYAHTSKNVLSATMAGKLLSQESRFQFSHDFLNIPLKHLLSWVDGEDNLEFKLRTVVNQDGDKTHIHDMFVNNIIYRPAELSEVCCYDFISRYELKKISKKRLESGDTQIDSNKSFNLLQEHPSHKHMMVSKRPHIVIPCITSINLLPDFKELHVHTAHPSNTATKLREVYAKIVLLLFYPYRSEYDLILDGSFWKRFIKAKQESKFSSFSLSVCQNM